MIEGEHWIMIARLDKPYYFANSLAGLEKTTYSFLTKKKLANVSQKTTKKTDNLCGFYAIY